RETVAVADGHRRDTTVARQAVLQTVGNAGPLGHRGDPMDVRAPLERGSQPERAGEMRRRMEPVERDTWTDRVAARDGAERGDARARRRVDPAWRRRDRAHHVGETRELRAI